MTNIAKQVSEGGEAVASDPRLLSEIRRYGRFDPTGCYQCGSCTLSCELATGPAAFPRRVLRYALLGLRQPLAGSIEPWLCQDCGDCSTACPRRAEPRASVESLRRFLIGQYDWTGLAGRILRSRAWYVGAMAVSAALVLMLIVLYHLWQVDMQWSDFTDNSMGLSHMFPTMIYFTLVVTLVPLFLLISNAVRMWWFALGAQRTSIGARHYLAELPTLFVQAATQMKMRACSDKRRWLKHSLLASGTGIMLVLVMFFLRWLQTDDLYPLYHPQRWLGYLATAMMIGPTTDILLRRLWKKYPGYQPSSLAEVTFPLLLLATAVSGIAVHILRYLGAGLATHWCYAAHIVIATPMLVVEIPFGKWSHMIYRPVALYLHAVSCHAAAEAPAGEAAVQHA